MSERRRSKGALVVNETAPALPRAPAPPPPSTPPRSVIQPSGDVLSALSNADASLAWAVSHKQLVVKLDLDDAKRLLDFARSKL